jgi:hypothetical protein
MSEANPVEICGQPLKCVHCGNDTFHTRNNFLLNIRGMTLLRADAFDDATRNYICARCGHVMWFYDLQADKDTAPAEPVECLACHAIIPPLASACPACGWSYKPKSGPPI